MKTLKNIFFIIILFHISTLIAFPQTESEKVSDLKLKNIKNEKTFTIKQDEVVVLYLADQSKVKGKFKYINDAVIKVDTTLVNINKINRLKYCDEAVKEVKTFGKVNTCFIGIVTLSGLGIVLANYDAFINSEDVFDMPDLPFLGYTAVVMGLITLPYAALIWAIPYRSFNLTNKWVIVNE